MVELFLVQIYQYKILNRELTFYIYRLNFINIFPCKMLQIKFYNFQLFRRIRFRGQIIINYSLDFIKMLKK